MDYTVTEMGITDVADLLGTSRSHTAKTVGEIHFLSITGEDGNEILILQTAATCVRLQPVAAAALAA